MGKYYHIYECKNCNRRWGTEKGDGTQPRACDDCQQFCRSVESRGMVHNYFKCACGSDWTSKNGNPTKCKKCGTKVICSRPDSKGSFGKSFADPSSDACKAKHWERMMEERERRRQQEQRKFSSHQNLSSFGINLASGGSHDRDSYRGDRHDRDGQQGDRHDRDSHHGVSHHRDSHRGDNHDRRPTEGYSRHQTLSWDELRKAESDRLFDLGNRHLIDGSYELAVEKYTEAIGLSPQHVEAYYKNRSRANMKLNKFEEAEKDLLQSLQRTRVDTRKEEHASTATTHDSRAHQTSTALDPSSAQNVRVMQALYDNDFEPVHLGKILGSNADLEELKALISKEMSSALASTPMIKFDTSSGYCSIAKVDEVCQKDGWKYSVCRGECNRWHICKKCILGNCEFGSKCARIHDFFHSRNTKLLERNNLYGVDPKILRALFLSQHRPQCMRPSLCHRYHTSKCYNSTTCTYLHVCINFQNQCKCSASHDLFSDHNRKVLDYCNVSMDGRCSKEQITKRIALWSPMVVPPIKPQKTSALDMQGKKETMTKQSATPAAKTQKVAPLKPKQPEPPKDKTAQSRNTHLERRMALERPEDSDGVLMRSREAVHTQQMDICGIGQRIRAEELFQSETKDTGYNLQDGTKSMNADIINDDKKMKSEPVGVSSASTWIPVWQYNPGKRGWKNFPEVRQAELEAAICDVETEVKTVFIEGKAVGVNMDYMSVDEYTESGGVEVRRMFARDKWKWYMGNKFFNQWSEITGEGGTDVQGQIERAFKHYKSTDSEPTKRMRISNGQVLLDFQEWIVRGGQYLDLRRRPDPN